MTFIVPRSSKRKRRRRPAAFALRGALLAVMLVAGAGSARAATPKFNVLFIVSDDLNCDLGCYGAKEMQTPNIDRLAARGVRFSRAYCQYPLCSPSRASFLTGRRPNVTGVLLLPTKKEPVSPHFRQYIPATVTLPELFKEDGAFAARVGKMYHYAVPREIGTGGLDDPLSWTQTFNPRGRDCDEESFITKMHPGKFGDTLSWLAADGDDTEQTDGIGATDAIGLLEKFKRERRPFFLGVGFYRPHTPYVAPKKWFGLYPKSRIELPTLSADDKTRTPAAAYLSARKGQDEATDDLRRDAIQAYHASTSFVDAQVGRVVDALDRLGLAENTIIVFTSDHGYHLGDHGLWQKYSLFERSTRVPLIIVLPNGLNAGKTADGLVEMVDIYPTLAALCGLPAPSYLDGTDLRPMLEQPAATLKDAAFSQIEWGNIDGYSVRTDRWRYTEWVVEGRQTAAVLFDETNDPAEAHNLVYDPAQAGLVAKLHERLELIRPVRKTEKPLAVR
ncbi:MAG TPA: sulfatase [Opitutus sp.]|nr:sulfatase [Opitutus sp.]